MSSWSYRNGLRENIDSVAAASLDYIRKTLSNCGSSDRTEIEIDFGGSIFGHDRVYGPGHHISGCKFTVLMKTLDEATTVTVN
jgi:hypothetical protein